MNQLFHFPFNQEKTEKTLQYTIFSTNWFLTKKNIIVNFDIEKKKIKKISRGH